MIGPMKSDTLAKCAECREVHLLERWQLGRHGCRICGGRLRECTESERDAMARPPAGSICELDGAAAR